MGRVEEAYRRYALTANRTGTCLGWFRAVTKKYPDKPRAVVLSDLVQLTPGDEGKWFAAAKDARLFDEAVALANRTPCNPRTLTRAARDFAEKNPAFAVEAGFAALRWLVQGYGYESRAPTCGPPTPTPSKPPRAPTTVISMSSEKRQSSRMTSRARSRP